MAPPGCDAFYVLAPVPHLDSGTDWATRGRALPPVASPTCLDRDRDARLPGPPGDLAARPRPWTSRTGCCRYKGAAFGLEPLLLQSAWFRPHNRSEDIDRLFMVGAGTHPGAGMPGVLSSAKALETVLPEAATLPRR
jgi:phytoene desaturase